MYFTHFVMSDRDMVQNLEESAIKGAHIVMIPEREILGYPTTFFMK